MERIVKSRLATKAKPDAGADIGLINQYTLKPLSPEDVFTFSVILCSNEIDRDIEKFTEPCLAGLAPLFVGKTGIFGHSWNAKDQTARIYRAALEDGEGKNEIGEQTRQLKADAYIPRGEHTDETIAKIETGILREVSVGVRCNKCACSICGKPFKWWGECEDGHRKGMKYEEGGLCYGKLEDPADAYEFSFVAVPAQRNAGVTKCCGKCEPGDQKTDCANRVAKATGEMLDALAVAEDLREHADKIKALVPALQNALVEDPEQKERARILAENKAYQEKYARKN